jgi:hypothetical protein
MNYGQSGGNEDAYLEDGQVLQDVVLDARDVLRLHPVLARRAHESLRGPFYLLRHLPLSHATVREYVQSVGKMLRSV